MISIESIEIELQKYKEIYQHNFFRIIEINNLRETIKNHFKDIQIVDQHGVYIIRQEITKQIIYIGKSGTIDNKGRVAGQNIPKRLLNVRTKNISSNDWFKQINEEFPFPLIIEYILLSTQPVSPTFVESLLIQAYVNEYGKLPPFNLEF